MRNLLKPLFICLCIVLSNAVYAQVQPLNPGYYVVVGAYASSKEVIAKKWVDILNGEGFQASYGYNANRKMYLVYLSFFDNLKNSLLEMQRLRRESKFTNAWVRVIPGDIRPSNENISETPVADVGTVAEQSAITSDASPEPASAVYAGDSIVVTDNEEIKQYKQMTLGNTEVFLSLFQAVNNRIVDGEVIVVDKDRAKQLTKVKGNEYLLLPDPKSKSGQLILICDVFGYRKIEQEINYPIPLADTVKSYIELMGTTLVVNFDLTRYRKGDVTTLNDVQFYNDAAVMLPESKSELNALVQLLQESKDSKILLHGHTNGNYNGKIIKIGADKNFFALDGSVTTTGSAKDLSRFRAEVIKEFLVQKGIAPDRVEIKAWGGKKPLYDRNGANARKNVRVEVEVL